MQALHKTVLGESVVWLGRFSIEIEDVVSEAVDVLCEVRADGGDGVFGGQIRRKHLANK
jgi:hypothetical protein